MKVMILLKASKDSEAGVVPAPEFFTAMSKYNEELVNAGVMLAGEGLHPSANGARIRFADGTHHVTKGPFPETRHLVSGFWIWNVDSIDDAVAWVKKSPFPLDGGTEIEIRRIFTAEDFGDAVPEAVKQKEAELRARAER